MLINAKRLRTLDASRAVQPRADGIGGTRHLSRVVNRRPLNLDPQTNNALEDIAFHSAISAAEQPRVCRNADFADRLPKSRV